MIRVLGIDLGTTNSCVAVVESGTPLVVPVDKGRYILPSVVAFRDDGRHLVGRIAKRQAVLNAENTVFAAKRVIGLNFEDDEAQRAVARVPYQSVAGPTGDVRFSVAGREVSIPEVSALLLAELRRAAEEHFSENIDKAVITVPAYFNDHQRQATRDAGRIAGLDVIRILNEPTAAALAYGALGEGGPDRHVVVYDLGGGTFDVSVLHLKSGVVEVLATAGDPFLGGRDFDDRILDWLTARIEREHGLSLKADRNAMQRLREASELAKIELSDRLEARIALPFLSTDRNDQPIHVDYTLPRDQFQGMVEDLIQKTMELFVRTLNESGRTKDGIDEVILVGGMTRVPAVQRAVEGTLGRHPSTGVHADLVVAVGAAIQGALLQDDAPATILLDVTPHNLGIMALGGIAESVIPKDTTIPTESKRIFTTVKDNQDSVRIVVFQGDNRLVQKNQVLGQFILNGIRPAPRGDVQIEVTFHISNDGLVSVSAMDIATGQAQSIEIQHSPTLQEDELRRMISDHQDQLLAALDDPSSLSTD